jgi:hypothetical protein
MSTKSLFVVIVVAIVLSVALTGCGAVSENVCAASDQGSGYATLCGKQASVAPAAETEKANKGLLADSNGNQCVPQQRVRMEYTDARGLNTTAYVCKTVEEVNSCVSGSNWIHSVVGDIHVATCLDQAASK